MPRLAQLKSNFTVLDVDDQVRLLKQLLQAEDIDDKRWPARMLAGLIDGWKNRGLTPSQVPAGEAAVFANGKGGKLYTSYQERLKVLNAADFGDLLLENIRIFREHPDVLRQFQQRFKFILVDEYQDTNVAQYLWLRLLSQAPSCFHLSRAFTSPPLVTEVGGECEPPGEGSLRVFFERARGNQPLTRLTASPLPRPRERVRKCQPLKRPSKTSAASATTTSRSMAGAARRSTTSCASNTTSPARKSSASSATTARPATSWPRRRYLIAHNEGRLGKTLRTEDVDGEKVTVTGVWDSEEEARAIGEEIEELQRKGDMLNEIAILVRASFQMRELEDRFVTLGLPYRVIGGPRFMSGRNPRRAGLSARDQFAGRRSRLRAHRQRAQARPRRRHRAAAARPRPQAPHPAVRGRARGGRTDELTPKARGSLRGVPTTIRRSQRDVRGDRGQVSPYPASTLPIRTCRD